MKIKYGRFTSDVQGITWETRTTGGVTEGVVHNGFYGVFSRDGKFPLISVHSSEDEATAEVGRFADPERVHVLPVTVAWRRG